MGGELTTVPTGYLEVAGLDFVPFRELADRRAWLLDAIGSVGPGATHAGVQTAALVLPAVLTELHQRARTYARAARHQYECACGFSCTGLATFDEHMDVFPPESPDSAAHVEL